MSEYVPTTEQVRAKYARGMRSDGTPMQFVKWQKEFDRFIAQVRAEAWDEGYEFADGHHCADPTCYVLTANPYKEVTLTVHEWLDARADRIEAGDE